MRVYEEYASKADKRRAQRGAKRGVATGEAMGYLLVFNEDGLTRAYSPPYCPTYNAFGELLGDADGVPRSTAHVTPSLDYLSEQCRLIGFDTLPVEWKQAFAKKLVAVLADVDDPDLFKRYRRVTRHASKASN